MNLSIDGTRQEDREYLLARKGELIEEIIDNEDILSVTAELRDRIQWVYEEAGLRDAWLEIARVAFTKKMIALAKGTSFSLNTRTSALSELIGMGKRWPGLLELLKFSDADLDALSQELETAK